MKLKIIMEDGGTLPPPPTVKNIYDGGNDQAGSTLPPKKI